MNEGINLVLKTIMRTVYENRRPLAQEPKVVVRHETANGRPMCEVWFMTEGCAYDCEGGCTMCNYGKGHTVDVEIILAALSMAFKSLPQADYNLVINPSGSFLDTREVSDILRNGIYNLLDNILFKSLTVESRVDVLQEKTLSDLHKRYYNRDVSVEMGVETLNPWLLRNSVNKGVTIAQINDAVRMTRQAGLLSVANIGLGLPFINERANTIYARDSIIAAIKMGFDSVILFPYHVKPGTLLEILYLNGLYQCVSLWALADVLSALPKELLPKVNISWYRNYYTDKTKIISSPDTCPVCRQAVLNVLDDYKCNPSEKTLAAFNGVSCNCRNKWLERLEHQVESIEFENVEKDYRFLAKLFHIDAGLLENTFNDMKEALYVNR